LKFFGFAYFISVDFSLSSGVEVSDTFLFLKVTDLLGQVTCAFSLAAF